MYQIGECVVYRAEGVCRISDIRQESFGVAGNDHTYYILTPMRDMGTTLFVPTDNELLTSMMRPLLSIEELIALGERLREERMEWIPESRGRNAHFREILSRGDREELIVMLQTVRAHARQVAAEGKRPMATDAQAIGRASELLLAEFSATTDIDTEAALFAFLDGERRPNARGLTENT